MQGVALFIMPDGADSSYAVKLHGVGNTHIKEYVQNEGAYLGLYAGAYYGSTAVEFDKDGPLEVIAKRQLAFFPGKSVEPILAPDNYKNNSGARVANLALHLPGLTNAAVYSNGGGYFNMLQTTDI